MRTRGKATTYLSIHLDTINCRENVRQQEKKTGVVDFGEEDGQKLNFEVAAKFRLLKGALNKNNRGANEDGKGRDKSIAAQHRRHSRENKKKRRDEEARDLLKGCVSRCCPSSNAT